MNDSLKLLLGIVLLSGALAGFVAALVALAWHYLRRKPKLVGIDLALAILKNSQLYFFPASERPVKLPRWWSNDGWLSVTERSDTEGTSLHIRIHRPEDTLDLVVKSGQTGYRRFRERMENARQISSVIGRLPPNEPSGVA